MTTTVGGGAGLVATRNYTMAKKSTATTELTWNTLDRDFQATRLVWNDGVEALKPTIQDLLEQLTQLGGDLYDSPLGKRAQRHPVASLGIAAFAFVVCRKLLRSL
jgi:hypothetical protein